MKTRFVISIVTFLLILPFNMEAQKRKSITKIKSTDSLANTLIIDDDYVKIYTNDSLIIIRKDIWESENMENLKELWNLKELSKKELKKLNKSKSETEPKSLQEIKSYSGKIIQWHHNHTFKCDGFYFQTKDDTLLVKFTPKLATRIKSLDKHVEVSGIIEKRPIDDEEIIWLTQVNDKKDTIHSSLIHVFHKEYYPSGENLVEENAKIAEIKYTKKGRIYACVLDNHVVLRFLFYAPKSLSQKLQIDLPIKYTGYEIMLREGEVIEGNYEVLRCFTITIDGEKQTLYRGNGWVVDGIRY